jgi:hypothetical protein
MLRKYLIIAVHSWFIEKFTKQRLFTLKFSHLESGKRACSFRAMRLLPPQVTPDTPITSQFSVGIVNRVDGEERETADENQATKGGDEQCVSRRGKELSE